MPPVRRPRATPPSPPVSRQTTRSTSTFRTSLPRSRTSLVMNRRSIRLEHGMGLGPGGGSQGMLSFLGTLSKVAPGRPSPSSFGDGTPREVIEHVIECGRECVVLEQVLVAVLALDAHRAIVRGGDFER